MFKKELIYRGCETTESKGDELYLIRIKIIDRPNIGLFFHRFLKSDVQDLHDHPWNYYSLILWRGYNETTFIEPGNFGLKTKRIYPGMIIKRPASHAHRVELIKEKPACTIILRFKKLRNWGFWLDLDHWTHWRTYWTNKGC